MMFTIIDFYSLQDGENAELPNSHRMRSFFHQGANSGLLLPSEGGDHDFMTMSAMSLLTDRRKRNHSHLNHP